MTRLESRYEMKESTDDRPRFNLDEDTPRGSAVVGLAVILGVVGFGLVVWGVLTMMRG